MREENDFDDVEPEGREEKEDRDDFLRDENDDLRTANRRELREENIETLRSNVSAVATEWKVEFRVGKNGVDIFEGDRLVATVYSPVDAQRLMEIIGNYPHVTKIAENSLAIVGDLNRYLYGERAKQTVKFVTDSNYILGVLKAGRNDLAQQKEALDKPNSKA